MLLTKLQIVRISDRDLGDIAALLSDHPLVTIHSEGIDVTYLSSLWAADWGLYRTCRENLARLTRTEPFLSQPGPYDPREQAQALIEKLLLSVHERLLHGQPAEDVFAQLFAKQRIVPAT